MNQFESRKEDHMRLALDPRMEATGASGFDSIHLTHEALPELDFSEINIATKFWSYQAASPLFISSMTAGHHKGEALNRTLAKVAAEKRWPMGLGSQRRELEEPTAREEWKRLRAVAPKAFFLSNIGLSQLIKYGAAAVLRLVDTLEAGALIVHTNPLQESLQPEGTPQFKGGLKALSALCKASPVPVVLKETGCGFSAVTLKKIQSLGLAAVDVSGFGGTHWGRIEGGRSPSQSLTQKAALTFAHWGENTVDTLQAAVAHRKSKKLEIWASGGIRSGLDAAKALALGAQKVGFAKPALVHAMAGEEALATWIEQMEFELKVAHFCSGVKRPADLGKGKRWRKI